MEEGYKYQDSSRVRSYLIAHPHLYLALEKARVELENAFPDTPVRLEVVGNDYGLYVIPESRLGDAESRKAMGKFLDWWLNSEMYSEGATFVWEHA